MFYFGAVCGLIVGAAIGSGVTYLYQKRVKVAAQVTNTVAKAAGAATAAVDSAVKK